MGENPSPSGEDFRCSVPVYSVSLYLSDISDEHLQDAVSRLDKVYRYAVERDDETGKVSEEVWRQYGTVAA
jgi:hypothetical protein